MLPVSGDGFLVTAAAVPYDRFGTGDLGGLRRALAATSNGFTLGSVELPSRLLRCRRPPEVRGVPDARMAGRGQARDVRTADRPERRLGTP